MTALALAGIWVAGGTAHARAPRSPTRAASTHVSFAGSVFDAARGENVDLAGALHVVTQPSGGWHVNVDHTTGTGESSGLDYLVHGAARGVFPPGPPVRTATVEATFPMFPLGPPVHPPSPIRFLITLSVGEGGDLSHVEVHVAASPLPTID